MVIFHSYVSLPEGNAPILASDMKSHEITREERCQSHKKSPSNPTKSL